MAEVFHFTDHSTLEKLAALPRESKNVIVLSSFFDSSQKAHPISPSNYQLSESSISLISECVRTLRFGGLFFVYGLPHHLALWGERISDLRDPEAQMLFKYWIALDIDETSRAETLTPSSLGLLMFVKGRCASKTMPFNLNTSAVRAPHAYCSACDQNLKDWGGKKHLMNPNGAALSDVWRDLPKIAIQNHLAPEFVLGRIFALTRFDGAEYLHVAQNEQGIIIAQTENSTDSFSDVGSNDWSNLTALELNRVYQGDCISFLDRIATLYPEGLFDLAFADPPYNLKKSYSKYNDTVAELHYIEWCNRWLGATIETLKPGGSLFVLNIPKWAIHHAAFLHRRLEFRHWIVWDALSDPRGKLMPAHYALLYYTKPGAAITFNYSTQKNEGDEYGVTPPDSPQYCLRASCIKKRKRLGDDRKAELSDVWFDVHRIKHKSDRDAHPCQLPGKLMERIILLTTRSGDLIFDPFCGTGTTALAARKHNRNFVTIDLDPEYARIATEKLEAMERHADLFGVAEIPRRSLKKTKAAASKKEIEIYLQRLAKQLGKEPSVTDIEADDAEMLRKIDLIYPTRLAAIKRCRVALRA